MFKKDIRYGPGILHTGTNEADIGFWYGDKLVRLLVAHKVTFEFDEIIQPPDKTVELPSWKQVDIIFDENIQNEFVGHIVSRTCRNDDPYMDKVLKEKQILHKEFLRSLESMVAEELEYSQSIRVEIPNLTRVLKEIFTHFRKYEIFDMYISTHLKFRLNGFEIGKV